VAVAQRQGQQSARLLLEYTDKGIDAEVGEMVSRQVQLDETRELRCHLDELVDRRV